MSLRLGQRARCQVCGGKIALVDHPGINLGLGMWVHVGTVRRLFAAHHAEGPTS